MKKKPQVIDFFCGAGGFSEGFRQQGFQVVMGIDNWAPALYTHNLNHNLKDETKDVLDFESIDEIYKLPDTEVIVGSPPCVLFSLSNKGGKADKTLGIKLIESFLRVIAIKKHQPSSKLVAWFMENVPNSRNFVKPTYTFRDLNLVDWARSHKINPDKVALNASVNGRILNTADFGASQKRERFVCGEIVATGKFPAIDSFIKKEYKSIGMIKSKMPKPNSKARNDIYADPNYPQLKLKVTDITNHFYDSGLYASQWKSAKNLKLNHPFMGKMSFPEAEDKPSRTIMATRALTSRESLVYKSEYSRRGNGEYRLPTIREISTLMGFPYTYQFVGGENTKWRQIGNAVCPYMSAALAKSIRISIGLKPIFEKDIEFNYIKNNDPRIENLNTFSKKKFDNPPKRNITARFRRHPFKEGNMTVALTNFNPKFASDDLSPQEWQSIVFMGSGKDFILKTIPRNGFKKIEQLIKRHDSDFVKHFVGPFHKKFNKVIGKSHKFQEAYVGNYSVAYEPNRVIEEIGEFITCYSQNNQYMEIPELIPEKERVPTKQVLAMYAINRIIS